MRESKPSPPSSLKAISPPNSSKRRRTVSGVPNSLSLSIEPSSSASMSATMEPSDIDLRTPRSLGFSVSGRLKLVVSTIKRPGDATENSTRSTSALPVDRFVWPLTKSLSAPNKLVAAKPALPPMSTSRSPKGVAVSRVPLRSPPTPPNSGSKSKTAS